MQRLVLAVQVLLIASSLGFVARAQETPPGSTVNDGNPTGRQRLALGVTDAVNLATTHNSALRVIYYDHLIERTRIAEAEGAFEPVGFVGSTFGQNEVIFPQIFPTGNLDPNGNPEFFQTIVTDSSVVADWHAGVRGLAPTGATWQLQVRTDYRDRERGGLVDPSYATSTSFNLTQPILRGAWLQYNQANQRQAEFAESQSRQRFRGQILDTIQSVHAAYWNLVFAQQDLQVKQRSLEVAQRLLEINRVKVETGVFAPIEITSAESGVASRVTDVLVAENQVGEKADALRRLILPFKDLREWDTDIVTIEAAGETYFAVPGIDDCVAVAFEERPDLVETRLLIRSRELSVSVADVDTMPKLDFVGQGSLSGLGGAFGTSIDQSYTRDGAGSWTVGLSLEVPLGNKAARSRLSRARLERDQALMSYRNNQLSAVDAVRRAHRAVDIAEKTIASRRKAAELKEQELKNEQIKLESKVSTNFQVLQVEEDLALRRSEWFRALVDYRIALATLAREMGTSLEVLKWPTK